MRVLFVTSELATVYKRGGLADVSYSLPVALARAGASVAVAMPYYDQSTVSGVACVGQLAVDYKGRRELVFVFEARLADTRVPVYLFRHQCLLEYDDRHIVDRFAFFSKAVVNWLGYPGRSYGGSFDLVHCQDWHTGLVPVLLGENRKTGKAPVTLQARGAKTVFTIHNHLYMGETGAGIAKAVGLPKGVLHEFTTPYGAAVRLLEEGIAYADAVTTVSPTYARELVGGEHGKRLAASLTRRTGSITGILNGIDTGLWDPGSDPFLPVHYTISNVIKKKQAVKSRLRQAVKLPEPNGGRDVPLFGFVGRLEARQKGCGLIIEAARRLAPDGFHLVLLGTGEKVVEKELRHVAQSHPHVAFVNTFDERLARRIYAGSDFLLVPSAFEPCGLTQMIAMRYGTLPLVRKTGGLADTVCDGKTGFVFGPYTAAALTRTMTEAIVIYRDEPETFTAMIRRVMQTDFSWDHQVRHYLKLYRSLR